MKHIQQIIEEHGGLAAVQRNYLRIENPPFMRLVIEVVGQIFPNGSCEVSVGHYGEQNGDAMRDPEITFLVIPSEDGEWQWKPLTFLNDYVGVLQQAASYDEEGNLEELDPPQSREIHLFSKMWDVNLKQQGFMEAFHRQHACTLHGAQIGETSAVS